LYPVPIALCKNPELFLEEVRMKKVKFAFWLLIVALVAVLVVQNKEFFTQESRLGIDLPYFEKYEFPVLHLGFYFLLVFLIGFLFSYFLSLSNRFQSRRSIRQLNDQVAVKDRKIAELQSTIAVLEARAKPDPEPEAQQQEVLQKQQPADESETES
jgi:uncharacterized integral membrane protein